MTRSDSPIGVGAERDNLDLPVKRTDQRTQGRRWLASVVEDDEVGRKTGLHRYPAEDVFDQRGRVVQE